MLGADALVTAVWSRVEVKIFTVRPRGVELAPSHLGRLGVGNDKRGRNMASVLNGGVYFEDT